jgi:chemotaxis signal transduction protein
MTTKDLADSSAPATAEQSYAVLMITLGDRRFGLPLESVERVMPMAHVLSLPGSGDGLLGMLNVHGQILPVVDAHPRLGLPSPHPDAGQRLVLVRARAQFLLWVDGVDEVVVGAADAVSSVPAQQASPLVSRVLRLGDAIVPVLAPAALEPRGSHQ